MPWARANVFNSFQFVSKLTYRTLSKKEGDSLERKNDDEAYL